MKAFINKLFLTCILFLFSLTALAKTQEQVLTAFAAWDKNINNLFVSFDQATFFEDILISSSTGTLTKEGQNLILDTYENGKLIQRAFTDKEIIKIFDPQGNLITTSPWQTWQQAQTNKALFDFGNYAQILKEHKVKNFKEEDKKYLLVLEGQNEQDTYELTFVLDEKSFPTNIILESQGVKTTTNLNEIKLNKKESLK
ncbi:MAG: hypothetical protein II972_02960 [Elusimicrobiaceae bacterium]|nr:hypothetical protein [Elusimicrobiaceae bacterium]